MVESVFVVVVVLAVGVLALALCALIGLCALLVDRCLRLFPRYRLRRQMMGPIRWPGRLLRRVTFRGRRTF